MMRGVLMSGVAVLWIQVTLMAQPLCESGPFRLLSPDGGPPVTGVTSVAMGQSECGPLVAAWVQQDGDLFRLLTAFSVDGITWSSSQELFVRDGMSYYGIGPAIGIDGSGKVLVAWAGGDTDMDGCHVLYSVSSDNGVTWSAPARLVSEIPDYVVQDLNPVVLGLRNGGFVVAWESSGFFPEGSGQYAVHAMFTRSSDSANWQELDFLELPSVIDIDTKEVSISLVELNDSSLLAVFHRNAMRDGELIDLLCLLRSVDEGSSWQRIDSDVVASLDRPGSPQIGVDRATGRLVLAWESDLGTRVYVSISDDNGISWSEPFRVSVGETGFAEFEPQVSWRPGLGWGLAWRLYDGSELYAGVSFSDNGVDWHSPCKADLPYDIYGPYLACAPGARWLLYSIGFPRGTNSGTGVYNPIILSELSPEPAQESIPCSVPLCGCVGGLSFVAAFVLMAALKGRRGSG